MGLDVLLTWEKQRPPGMMGLLKLPQYQEAAMPTIARVTRQIKANLALALPEATLRRVVADLGRRFRQRTHTPVVTTYLFLRQVLHGNPAVGELRHLAGLDFTDFAYCQARQRLPVAFFY